MEGTGISKSVGQGNLQAQNVTIEGHEVEPVHMTYKDNKPWHITFKTPRNFQ